MAENLLDVISRANPYIDQYAQVAAKYGLDLPTLLAQTNQESHFNPNAVSNKGARGIAQFTPGTAKDYGIDPSNVTQSIDAQGRYMQKALQDNGGDRALSLAAYNAGQGAVNQYGGVPPFQETKDYLNKIQPMAEQLRSAPQLHDVLQQLAMGPPNPNGDQAQQIAQAQSNTPGSPNAAVVNPQTADPNKPKTNWVNNITAVLAGLGGLGGTAANIIGGIKHSGSPGNAAIEQSTSLLKILGDYDQKAQEDAKTKAKTKATLDYIANVPGLTPEQRAQATAQVVGGNATAGITAAGSPAQKAADEKTRLDTYAQEQKIVQSYKKPEDPNPELTKLTANAKQLDDLNQREAKGEKLSGNDQILQKKLSQTMGGLSEQGMTNLRTKIASKGGVADEYQGYSELGRQFEDFVKVAKQLPGGRIEGNSAQLLQKVLPNKDVTQYKKDLVLLAPQIAGAVATEKRLNQKQIDAMTKAISVGDLDSLEKEGILGTISKAIQNKVTSSYGRLQLDSHPLGKDFINELKSTGSITNLPEDIYPGLKQGAQKSSGDPIIDFASQIPGVTIRKK